jgi:hypothetical protein
MFSKSQNDVFVAAYSPNQQDFRRIPHLRSHAHNLQFPSQVLACEEHKAVQEKAWLELIS